MICKLCNSYFSYEIKFNNLFDKRDLCDRCKGSYIPKLCEELIPIDNGYVRYIYLYDETNLNQIQRKYLSKYFDILYNEIINHDSNLVIIINHQSYLDIKNEISHILMFKKITFVSLTRYNIDNLMYFD